MRFVIHTGGESRGHFLAGALLAFAALLSACSPAVNTVDPDRLPVDGVVVGPDGEERLERKELDGPNGLGNGDREGETGNGGPLPPLPGDEGFEEGGAEVSDKDLGAALARSAMAMVGKDKPAVGGKEFRRDCSGLIMAIYAGAGCYAGKSTVGSGGTAFLYERCKAEGRLFRKSRDPEPGDLVFFDNTYDRNRNKKCDDWLSHVGIVVAVDEDGTVTFVHWGKGGAKESRMNLKHPGIARSDSGKEWNNEVRPRSRKDRGCVRHLASDLFRGFCRLEQPCGE